MEGRGHVSLESLSPEGNGGECNCCDRNGLNSRAAGTHPLKMGDSPVVMSPLHLPNEGDGIRCGCSSQFSE